jgi:hypothetical protein
MSTRPKIRFEKAAAAAAPPYGGTQPWDNINTIGFTSSLAEMTQSLGLVFTHVP